MKELSEFVKTEFTKNCLFENFNEISNIDIVDNVVYNISCGKYINLKFRTSMIKEYFLDKLLVVRPDTKIINCNCSIECFNKNIFSISNNDLIVFNNIKNCKYCEILDNLKNYKAILIC